MTEQGPTIKPRLHYGSLEQVERARRAHQEENVMEGIALAPAKAALEKLEGKGIRLDDIDVDTIAPIQYTADQQAVLEEMERKKHSRYIAVPTDDVKVRMKLRELGEPQTYFAEGPGERRERLRDIIMTQQVEMSESSEEEEEETVEEFFTMGSDELLEKRRFITEYSLPRAKERLETHRAEVELPVPARKKMRHEWYTHLKTYATSCSQLGDDRPLSCCLFSPNSKVLATGAWSGPIKLWSVPDCNTLVTLRGHKDRVSGMDFHPQATLSHSPDTMNLVSGALDGSIHGWSFTSDVPVCSFEGHEMRVARVAFHPSGRLIGSASFDMTWRLWDVETQTELLLQEGHSRELFAIGFQVDGSLVATAGKDTIGRVWDLRTGRSVMVLQGHVKSILSLDWSPNGYQLATGSEDHSMRIWDLRGKGSGCIHTVPAHTNLVSQVKYLKATNAFESRKYDAWEFPGSCHQEMDIDQTMADQRPIDQGQDYELRKHILDGSVLVSSSYDGTCKIWTEGDWKAIKVLGGTEGKLMSCDFSSDGKYISTASYDRTFKLYSAE